MRFHEASVRKDDTATSGSVACGTLMISYSLKCETLKGSGAEAGATSSIYLWRFISFCIFWMSCFCCVCLSNSDTLARRESSSGVVALAAIRIATMIGSPQIYVT